jgi:hypothetical protein
MSDLTGQTPEPSGSGAPVNQGRAARRAAAEQADRAAGTLSRTERRRLEDQQAKSVQKQHALWKAWWFYLLLAVAAVAIVLGVRAAADAPPPAPVVTEIPNG